MESLVALVLITVSFTIGGMLHSRVLSDDRSMDRIRALGMIDGLRKGKEVPEEKTWSRKGVRVECEVSLYKGAEDLYQVTYKAYSKGREVPFLERQSLVLERKE